MPRIVDAHHHLWDLNACHYPWLMARGVYRFFGDPTPIQKNYLVDDFREDATAYKLVASVHKKSITRLPMCADEPLLTAILVCSS